MTSIAPLTPRAAAPAPRPAEATRPRQDELHPLRDRAPRPAPPLGGQQARGGAHQLRIPDWVKDAVFYQVFPDRFENGDLGNDPRGTEPWGSRPRNDTMMGGDLPGITQRMSYLTTLGVNALYLNPVFSAPSNHKYNTASHEQVDADFGGNEALRDLVGEAHRSGVKVMLDGVFNHVSHQHPWFEDVRAKGTRSEHADKFTINHWPIRYRRDREGVLRSDDYRSWWGYATLPELRTDNPKVRDYFLTGRDSIIKRWVRDYGIDGWRMDVADDPNFTPEYWRIARSELKATNPDAYLLAENWKDASSMLQGDQFDGTMNYQYFTFPAIEFFAKKQLSADAFVQRLETPYSTEARHGAFNILGSHDTPRFITQAGGDWYRLRPAAIFQMTYVGAPVVYYGDEIGMEGGSDPDSRRSMEWQHVPGARDATTPRSRSKGERAERAGQLFELYQRLIATRKAEPALRRGEFSVLATHNDDSTVAYRRHVDGVERDAIVALNNNVVGRDIRIPVASVAPDGTRFTDALSGRSFAVERGELLVPDVDGNFGVVLLRDA